MNVNDKALGRNWFTAHSAELTTFSDCARWTIRWDDGAEVTGLEDTREQALAALNRYGFAEVQS